jgi:NAD(P)-dependent dehydrogenase (short-subunit alcohol dehydrogenase family)
MRLEGRNAIITGAAQGLGLSIAERFVAEGAGLLVADVKADKVAAAAARLGAGGAQVVPFAVDVTDRAQVEDMVATAIGELGHVDILINNAGGSGDVSLYDIEAVTEEAWDAVVDRNLKGPFLCCRAVVPHMKERRYGRIVNFSSSIAKGTTRRSSTAGAILPYAASKAGVQGLTYQLAKALAGWNIVVNVVVPGFILTERGARVRDKFDLLEDEQKRQLSTGNPRGEAGRPEEMANTVLFLASDECSFVSGATIDVTGAA